jgi:hypothetical protein
MNIAFCLFGLPRCLEPFYVSAKHYIVDPLKCDIFIHTWNIDHGGHRFAAEATNAITSNRFTDDSFRAKETATPCYSKTVEEYIKENIKPKLYTIQNYQQFCEQTSTEITAALYNSINEVNLLRKKFENENNIKYDLIILCRMDLLFACSIPNFEIDNAINDPNSIYMTINRGSETTNSLISDGFIFGGPKAISFYANSFNFWKQHPHLKNESVYIENFKNTKVNVKRSKIKFYLFEQYTENEWYAIYHTK